MLARDAELSFRRSLLPAAAATIEARQGDEVEAAELTATAIPPARLVYAHVAGDTAQQHRERLGDGQSQLHEHGGVPPRPQQQGVGGAEAWMPVEAEQIVFEHRIQIDKQYPSASMEERGGAGGGEKKLVSHSRNDSRHLAANFNEVMFDACECIPGGRRIVFHPS